jgi:glycosyltransferase involved in cell wall biosynthesis
MARVTVGMPVYNGVRYLEQAVESILAQDFDDLEVLLADNASTDGTLEMCHAFAARDERVRVLPSEVNRGLAWNHNRVVEAATGEYFKWAAYDDVYLPGFVSACVDVLDTRPEVVLVYTETVEIDSDGREVTRWPASDRASAPEPWRRFRDVMLNERKCFPIYGLIRIEVLRRTELMGAFPSSDQPLLAELALHGQFAEVHEPLFLNREHAARSTTKFPSARERVQFFDPTRDARLALPRWRLAGAFVTASGRGPLTAGERAKALAGLPKWLHRWWRPMAGEVYRAGEELTHRGMRRFRSSARSMVY